MVDHVPAGPRPSSSTPHVRKRDGGWTVTDLPAHSRSAIPARPHAGRGVQGQHVPRTSEPPGHGSGGTSHPRPEGRGGRGGGAAGGPTRRGAGPPGRLENALREEEPADSIDQSKRNNWWGRGIARYLATGLKKRRRGHSQRWKIPALRMLLYNCYVELYNSSARYTT